MITEIKINNFKSVQDLTLPLGRFNVLIGANGSGKSNILEAIAFGGAASADKLDNEFLGSRGIRTASDKLMKSAFCDQKETEYIRLGFKAMGANFSFNIKGKEEPFLKWSIEDEYNGSFQDFHLWMNEIVSKHSNGNGLFKELSDDVKTEVIKLTYFFLNSEHQYDESSMAIEAENFYNDYSKELYFRKKLSRFIIYSPEISSLRKFEEENQILPLGIKGEGLFTVLHSFHEFYLPDTVEELRRFLHIIDWFSDFEVLFDTKSWRRNLLVKDKHLPDVTLNQHNVNEGFLFLLFYISLIISKETPAFFAIDNIEASFHPKLCEELIRNLVALAKKHDKQIILTTHNPFVLDGLDLNDTEQKLFVVRRNADGATIADNINKAPSKIKLSEAWMRGYIGGHPETIE